MIGLAKLSYLQDPMSDRNFFLSATLGSGYTFYRYTIIEKVFAKHRKIEEDINNKKFPVRVISLVDS